MPELDFQPEKADGNLIIEGDNLLALKVLLPLYAGKIKCIYIDPPYNTGNEGWIYNDNANSPLLRDWLSREVGRDDLTRHDKWLCISYRVSGISGGCLYYAPRFLLRGAGSTYVAVASRLDLPLVTLDTVQRERAAGYIVIRTIETHRPIIL